MTPKHDYAKALEYLDSDGGNLADHSDAIRHALKLAEKVTGEPSEGIKVLG